jgi:cell division protein YceG involved in septum cleavage
MGESSSAGAALPTPVEEPVENPPVSVPPGDALAAERPVAAGAPVEEPLEVPPGVEVPMGESPSAGAALPTPVEEPVENPPVGDPPEDAPTAEQPAVAAIPVDEPVEVRLAASPAADPPAPLEPAAPPESSSFHTPMDSSPAPIEPWGGSPRRRGGRLLAARGGALLALAAVIAAVVLVVQSLGGKGHVSTATHPTVVKVVIPEGKNRLQIAQIAAADGLSGSYRAAAKRSSLLNPAHYGAPRGTPNLEGFLFPATYEVNPGLPVSRLVAEQLIAFRQRFGTSEIRRARALHVTAYQMLTVASMIEREAQTAHDRPLIAAVVYNRLKRGMPLGIDATIYYAVELRKGIATYTQELTEAQLHIDSPYNTRTHAGLPPTPISNPGLASIEAAAHPARVPYLYYVAAADGCGEQTFSRTYAEFELNVAAYQAAVKKNGGHPPTCKRK